MITSFRPRTAVALWVLVVLAALVAGRALDAPALLVRALEWIRGLGPLGAVIFVLLYVLATVLFLPGSILSLGAGAVFGVVKGGIMVSVSATLGATAAFLVGRYLAREWVTRKVEGHPRFAALDEALAREGWKVVALMRLSPVVPFNLLNYVFGVTRVRLRDYVLASWIGMMPGGIMYVYLGSLIGDLATLSAGTRTRSTAEWAFYAVGLLATVAVTIYVTRVARAALRKRVTV
jgi:uncharacterized membrane protein YdjX (TVP38/TMEM64 family)